MKQSILINVILLSVCSRSFSQEPNKDLSGSQLIRIYEDNDFLNLYGNGTDRAYSNGISLDYFKASNGICTSLLDRVFPKAGKHSTDIYSWSITHLIYTPNNLRVKDFQPNDYYYSGAILLSHALHSNNAERKYAIQSALTVGLRGSASLAEKMQKFVHKVVDDEIPAGWGNQLQPKLLINLNFTIEKQIASLFNYLEVINGLEISTGTLTNTASVYSFVRLGFMRPYFNGIISQFASPSSKIRKKGGIQAYLIFKPKASLVLSNSMIQGKTSSVNARTTHTEANNQINNHIAELNYGVVFVSGSFGISYLQKPSTPYRKGLYTHNVGNVSIYYNW